MEEKAHEDAEEPQPSDELSYAETEQLRAIKSRHLEIKMQALDKAKSQIQFERTQLTVDKEKYELMKTNFDNYLSELEGETKTKGYENVRIILEHLRPKLAKEHVLEMIEADETEDVVVLLAGMPIDKRAKIVGEFTTEAEVDAIESILRLIRKGGGVSRLIDDTRERAKTY